MTTLNEFAINPNKPSIVDDAKIIEEVGYGTKIDTDPQTNKRGLVPMPTTVMTGDSSRKRAVDNPECYAKAVHYANKEHDDWVYYVRMNSRGDLADPWGMYADSDLTSQIAKHKGAPQWEFKRVKGDVFMSYLNYLVTRNGALLRICDRDVKDNR